MGLASVNLQGHRQTSLLPAAPSRPSAPPCCSCLKQWNIGLGDLRGSDRKHKYAGGGGGIKSEATIKKVGRNIPQYESAVVACALSTMRYSLTPTFPGMAYSHDIMLMNTRPLTKSLVPSKNIGAEVFRVESPAYEEDDGAAVMMPNTADKQDMYTLAVQPWMLTQTHSARERPTISRTPLAQVIT